MWVSWVQRLRFAIIVCAIANLIVVIVGAILVSIVLPVCDTRKIYPVVIVSLAAGVKIAIMIKTGIAQKATAITILDSPAETIIRHERQMRYKAWLWWTRLAVIIAFIQFLSATYLILKVARDISHHETSSGCALGDFGKGDKWKQNLLVSFMIMACFVPVLHCFTGSDVLKWRSFYSTKDDVWKAHYQEVFDHSIREMLCCFGRFEYLRPVLDGDNGWRGHAAAFLKYIDLPRDVLRHGRVRQKRREAAYFILVLHHTKSVILAVRGTETPEDLITDGLGRECILSADDLDGLIKHVTALSLFCTYLLIHTHASLHLPASVS